MKKAFAALVAAAFLSGAPAFASVKHAKTAVHATHKATVTKTKAMSTAKPSMTKKPVVKSTKKPTVMATKKPMIKK